MTRSDSRAFGSSDLVFVVAVTSWGSLSYTMTYQLRDNISYVLTSMQYLGQLTVFLWAKPHWFSRIIKLTVVPVSRNLSYKSSSKSPM
jgi:hypothetical protein